MKVSKYKINTDKQGINIRFAVVSDLHARPYESVIDALNKIAPDAILLPGDIVEIASEYMHGRNQAGLDFLRHAAQIAPCYYCYGNHEIYYSHAKRGKSNTPDEKLSNEYLEKIRSYGINIINDSFQKLQPKESYSVSDNFYVGGLVCGKDMDPALNQNDPDLLFLKTFDNIQGFKILLCHYPHYYKKYLKDTSFDLILSGHAHGGQWRILGRGIYAPHQGLFPKYTSGIHDGRHIISRGVVNNAKPIPRFFNPCEVLEVHIVSKQ